ncbi:hypothetical protein PoB_005560800 [Plakobranchus ocellatus]|uniref:Uncharacterized protein n=1 Tax=Plakobranchus ocellatus TaxID=259542 RepID=A0AAV4CCC8_9GAST|nr:hypothetical protein PoB_005560800 [Plakobranchus ocellatus]
MFYFTRLQRLVLTTGDIQGLARPFQTQCLNNACLLPDYQSDRPMTDDPSSSKDKHSPEEKDERRDQSEDCSLLVRWLSNEVITFEPYKNNININSSNNNINTSKSIQRQREAEHYSYNNPDLHSNNLFY